MTRTWTSLWRFGYVARGWIMWSEWIFFPIIILNISSFRLSASGKHCASPGAVCQTRRAERRKCLHVRQVSVICLGWCDPHPPQSPVHFTQKLPFPLHLFALEIHCGWCIMTAFFLSAGAKRRCRRPSASRFTGRLMCWLSRWRGLPTSVEERLQRWTKPSRTPYCPNACITLITVSYFCGILI